MSVSTTQALTAPKVGELSQRGEWISRRDDLINEALVIKEVSCDADLEIAGALQSSISKHIKKLNDMRLDLTRRVDEVKKGIMDEERKLVQALQLEHDRLKGLNNAYATHKYQLAEAERMRIEEQRRREAEAEAARIAEENAKKTAEQLKAESVFGPGASAQPTAPAAPEPVVAPQYTKPHTESNTIAVVWDFAVVAHGDVPDEFKSVDERKIRAFLDMKKSAGMKAADLIIPGVKISVRADVRAR